VATLFPVYLLALGGTVRHLRLIALEIAPAGA
jgi:hypothetical protein